MKTLTKAETTCRADGLELFINNDGKLYDSVRFAVEHLRHTLDRAATALAKERADWHDDPEGDPDGHAAHHAPAIEQYPRAVRDLTALELVKYHLNRINENERREAMTTTTQTQYYDVFVRTWWRRNPAWPNGREPGPGKRRYIARHVTYEDARAICKQYNDTHDPGPLSKLAEFESV